MARKKALLATALSVAVSLGSITASAQERDIAATAIVACDHIGRGALTTPWTRVSGVDTAGPVPTALAAALRAGATCAEAAHVLALGGFELVHRVSRALGDFNNDGDVDGRDFLAWQRGNSPAPARPTAFRGATVILKCDYVVGADPLATVAGSDVAGAIGSALAAALVRGQSCAMAMALLAGAGFDLVSGGRSPAAPSVDSSDYVIWRKNLGTGG